MSALLQSAFGGVMRPVTLIFAGWIVFVFTLSWVTVRVAEWRQRRITLEQIRRDSTGFE